MDKKKQGERIGTDATVRIKKGKQFCLI